MSLFRSPTEFSSDSNEVSSRNEASQEASNENLSPSMIAGPLAKLGSFGLPMDSEQRKTIFYISLIEQRCKIQAAKSIGLPENHPNVSKLAGDLFSDMAKTLHKAGMLPDDFAVGQDLEKLRSQYMNYFDSMLHTMASKHLGTLDDSALRSFSVDQAPLDDHPIELYSFMLKGGDSGQELSKSIYGTEYKQISVLGKGGFGEVFKVLNYVDGQEYAIKKILITAERLRARKDRVTSLLSEVRALAQLNHQNIVRYYHGWIEFVPAIMRRAIGEMEESTTSISESRFKSQTDESAAFESNLDNLRIEDEMDVLRSDQGGFQPASADSKDYSDFFEREQSEMAVSQQSHLNIGSLEESNALVRRLTSREPTLSSADEEIHRTDVTGFDAVLYIKMGLHPLTLEDFIWPDQQIDPQINHCFHVLPAANILVAILDGIEYIHTQRIVHRDLKPSNVFLSVRRSTYSGSSLGGSIDIRSCKECGSDELERVFITPHIGDFGLVAELKEIQAGEEQEDAQPTVLAALSTTDGQPGTRFYHPASSGTICPKLDVYSLGVIAFELVYHFGTKSERSIVLEKLGKGMFPEGFKEHEMVDGIRRMLCTTADERWACSDVRRWLKGIIAKYE